MNERLKELYLQAHSTRRYDGDPALDGNPPTVYWQDEKSAQRFAELIVRECMKVTVNYPHPQTKLTAAEHISKHFGVEE